MLLNKLLLNSILAGILSLARPSWSYIPPYDPSPFTAIGRIDGMVLKNRSTLAGGMITVDGTPIIIPDNLLVTLPSIKVAWSEMFDSSGAPNLPGPDPWQAIVYGNRVQENAIAGLVYISQQQNRILQGFIESISLNGHLTINGQNCILNDPIGRFGPNYTAHPLWTVDADNPSVRTSTGFPVCIPRSDNDEECPSKNRPHDSSGNPVQILTFKDPAIITENDPDPRKMMPLAVGDYVTFSGININGMIAIYDLTANLGIYTAPGTKPAYVNVEEARWAVYQNDPNGEDGETKADTFTTDPTAVVEFFAVDVDPCNGTVSERRLMLSAAESTAPKGRARFRGKDSNFNPAPREIGFRLLSGTSEGPMGITAGQFIQPVMEYVFTELLVFGMPEIPIDFSLLPYLALGSGPYESGDYLARQTNITHIVRQLDPWPGTVAPSRAQCTSPVLTSRQVTVTDVPSPTSTADPGPLPDTITILTATTDNGQGLRHINVIATSNNINAKLSCALSGDDPVVAIPMTREANDIWSYTLDVKGKADTAVVFSDFGGTASATLVRA